MTSRFYFNKYIDICIYNFNDNNSGMALIKSRYPGTRRYGNPDKNVGYPSLIF